MMAGKKKYDFIILTRTPWHEIPRSRHQFTQALSEHYSCLFVESNTRGFRPNAHFIEVNENITVLANTWLMPYKIRYRIPWLSNLYYQWIRSVIEKTCDTQHTVWVTFDHTSIACNAHYSKSVYYATDDHTRSGAKKWNFFTDGQWKQEKELLLYCALTMVTAVDLEKKFSPYSTSIIRLPLAGPVMPFAPEPIRNQTIKRVAFLAAFNLQRVPVSILNALAANPDIELICIGPVKPDFRTAFSGYSNLTFTGPLTDKALYNELRSCDAGIAPYRTESVNSGVTPSKLWQYAACGLPVVVTRLPSMIDLSLDEKLITFCDDPALFPSLVVQAIKEDTDYKRNQRWQWSQQHTWPIRIHTFVDECRRRKLLP